MVAEDLRALIQCLKDLAPRDIMVQIGHFCCDASELLVIVEDAEIYRNLYTEGGYRNNNH